jgi:lipopolysaccharide/colanic/teichoic acid biosynthesis glycosyltransferase
MASRSRTVVLLVGDVCFLIVALWLALVLRHFEMPSPKLFQDHLVPFSLLFVAWVLVFFIAGLYERRSILLAEKMLPATLLTAQTVNVAIAAIFFFLIPYFGIAPKTLLAIYLIHSFVLVLLWRAVLFPVFGLQRAEKALVVGTGPEIDELVAALSVARHAPARIVTVVKPTMDCFADTIKAAIELHRPGLIIADLNDPLVASVLCNFQGSIARIHLLDVMLLYEEMFGRVPLSRLDDRWLAANIARSSLYDSGKRLIDVAGGTMLALASLLLYPIISVAILFDDGFPIFIAQQRVGEHGRLVSIYKFRTMSGNDNGEYENRRMTRLKITRVGRLLRSMRFDELPQLWNVVLGDLSLVGPRLELPALVAAYEHQIPSYRLRHLIKPGLSGWAQLYYHSDPHHAADVAATLAKLAYDLYYLKHRSLVLDMTIAIKTVRRILMKSNA